VRIVIVVRGGLVQNVYADQLEVEVDVLDYDNKAECDPADDEAEYYARIEKAIPALHEVW
jgi:hypothetical protein